MNFLNEKEKLSFPGVSAAAVRAQGVCVCVFVSVRARVCVKVLIICLVDLENGGPLDKAVKCVFLQ